LDKGVASPLNFGGKTQKNICNPPSPCWRQHIHIRGYCWQHRDGTLLTLIGLADVNEIKDALDEVCYLPMLSFHNWGTGIRGLMRGMATLPQGNRSY